MSYWLRRVFLWAKYKWQGRPQPWQMAGDVLYLKSFARSLKRLRDEEPP